LRATKPCFAIQVFSRILKGFVAISLLAGFLAIGCDSADYTVIKNVRSPEGRVSALLVQRQGHDSLSSDVYYVILIDNRDKKPSLAKATHDKPILVATHGWDLGIQWSDPHTLSITCAGCGMRPIDIIEKKAIEDTVNVTYMGFPNGTYKDLQ
jgi:hypothetical protein